ncbi:MAG: ThuA domain-containing protein [Propionibacteriaceae bacterium]|jgi:hypothetical protein|nr:ThuA domain-containing protein [Propionibacteriaceae bacterium]
MPKAIILSGSGRYADPWHPFAETSPLLAGLAHDAGWDTEIRDDIDHCLAAGLDGIGLIIVNAGDPWHNLDPDHDEPADPEVIHVARAKLDAAFDRGISLLGVHCAAASLRDYPSYRAGLGGEWVPGQSWHPPRSLLHVRPLHDSIVEGLCNFTVDDERYSDLTIDPHTEPLLDVAGEDGDIVLGWARQHGSSKIVYDALGHDKASYDSCGHKSFLRRVMSWLAPHHQYDD